MEKLLPLGHEVIFEYYGKTRTGYIIGYFYTVRNFCALIYSPERFEGSFMRQANPPMKDCHGNNIDIDWDLYPDRNTTIGCKVSELKAVYRMKLKFKLPANVSN